MDTETILTSPNGHSMRVIGHVDLDAQKFHLLQEHAGHDVHVEVGSGRYPVVEFTKNGGHAWDCYVLVRGRRTSRFHQRPAFLGVTTDVDEDVPVLIDVIDYCGRGHVRWEGYAAARDERRAAGVYV